MVRSCYQSVWNLPGWGEVAGYYYFADPGTPFLPGWSYLGSRNWHANDGSPWPNFGETESAVQSWKNGSFPGARPLVKLIGSEGCLDSDAPVLVPMRWRGGLPAACFPEDDMPTGGIIGFGGDTIPSGWLDCNGAAVSRIFFGDLFAAIGTAWGPGDGINTFNVPDLRGRTPVGDGQGIGLTLRTLADQGGEEDHLLTQPEMPVHDHGFGEIVGAVIRGPLLAGLLVPTPPILFTTSPAGGDQPHNNMQPFACVKFIIKT